MAKWTKEIALVALQGLAAEADNLKAHQRYSTEHTRWIFSVRRLFEEVFGESSAYCLTFAQLTWDERSTFVISPGRVNPQAAVEQRHQEAYQRQLDTAKGILIAAQDELKQSELEDIYKGKNTPSESSAILKIQHLAEHKLRKAMRVQPTREREVQDAFETLLIGADLEYSRETDSIEYSSKTYTPDFSFLRLDLALEVKICNRSGREKEIIAEINDDILAYGQKYGNQFFVIYDLGFIRDVDRFGRHFEEQEGVVVRVVKQ
jgi:hypothetical protein